MTFAQEKNRKALEAILDYGDKLSAARADIGHGDWIPFLEKHVPQISERTARRYMILASNRTHVSDLLTTRSAYLRIGIIPDAPPRRKQLAAPASAPVIDVEAVSSPATSDPAPSQKPAAAPVIATTPAEAQSALKTIQERKAAEQKPAPVIIMGADTVRAWLKTPDGEKFLAQIPKQPAAAPSPVAEPSQESSKFVRIPVGPPLTLALLKTALKSLVALIPMTADHEAFGNLISEYAAMELRLARDNGRRPVSPYS